MNETMNENVIDLTAFAYVSESQVENAAKPRVRQVKCSYCGLLGHNKASRNCQRKTTLMKYLKAFENYAICGNRAQSWFEKLNRTDYIIICTEIGIPIPVKTDGLFTFEIKRTVIDYLKEKRNASKKSEIKRLESEIKSLQSNMDKRRKDVVYAKDLLVSSHAELKKLLPEYEVPAESKISVKPTETDADIDCPVCFDAVKPQYAVTFGCHHQVCSNCTYELIQKKSECPLCRSSITGVTCHSNCIQASLQQLL